MTTNGSEMQHDGSEMEHAEGQSLLRAAAADLLPVVVDLGPEQARFSSFIGSFRDEGSGSLVLEPIAADALPQSVNHPLRIVPNAHGAAWVLTAPSIQRSGHRRACVDLKQARIVRRAPAAGEVAVQPTDLLVLVVPGGLHDGSTYVFPVQRIGTNVCEIRSNIALAPGTDLPHVELVGDSRLLRRASAQVLETTPWYTADGSHSFSSRLILGDDVATDLNAAHDLVTEPAEVRRLLQLSGATRAAGWFEAPGWARGTLQFLEVRSDHALLELSLPVRSAQPLPNLIRIGVEIFATAYEFDVRPLRLEGDRLCTALPLIARRRRRHRRAQRVCIGAEQRVDLSFRNPVTGSVETHRLTEVSFFGVRFECSQPSMVLWQGLPLEQGQLSWDDRLVHLGDIVVEDYRYDPGSESTACVASIPNSGIAENSDMISLMATLSHPHVKAHSGQDFSVLHNMYLKAGLFGPHMHRNLAPILDQTSDVWRRLHGQAADVARTFIHGPEKTPDAAVSIVRAWEHAWVLQHFVDTSSELSGATGKLQAAYLDHLVPRPDGRYLLFFVKTDNSIMNAYLRRFFASTGTPDAVARSTVELWSRAANAVPTEVPVTQTQIRACEDADEVVIARAAQRCLGAYATAALSFVPGELHIPDTRERFAKADLERRRTCSIVTRNNSLAYALVEEHATPGVNLTWMLNATWILPIHPESDPDSVSFDAALRHIIGQSPQTATGEIFLNLPEGLDAERLSAWGFRKEAVLYLYVLTRAGLHRFFHYAAHRYGELDARTQHHVRKRGSTTRESPHR